MTEQLGYMDECPECGRQFYADDMMLNVTDEQPDMMCDECAEARNGGTHDHL